VRGRRAWFLALCTTLIVVGAPTTGAAQDQAPLYLSRSEESGRLRLRMGSLFEDTELTQALHSGLPMRLQIVAELWKDGFFDSQKGRSDWRASIVFDPLERSYLVTAVSTQPVDTIVGSLEEVGVALQELFDLPLTPTQDGRFYYLGEVSIETLSLSDLEELQRWLRGNLSSDVTNEEERETAMGRGMRRLLVRVLGLPSRKFKVRSPGFEVRFRNPG